MAKVKKLFFIVALVSLQSAFLTALSWSQPNGYSGGQGGYVGGGSPYPNPDYIKVIPSDYYGSYGPVFYSGTNCRVGGPAVTGAPGAYIASMKLEIEGEVVASNTWGPDPDGTIHNGRSLNATFASTHFADGKSLTWKLTATDSKGNTNSKTHSGTVYNRASVYTRPGSGAIASAAATAALQAMNHSIVVPSNTKVSILGSLSNTTAFHFGGHGSEYPQIFVGEPDYIDPADNMPVFDESHAIFPDDVGNFTFSNSYKFNIVFLNSCHAANTNDFAQAFLNPQNNNGGYLVNQALVGWSETISTGTSPNSPNVLCAKAFWENLRDGGTADSARLEMVKIVRPDLDNEPLYMRRAIAPCWGDRNATLGKDRAYTTDGTTKGWAY
jgi:hypothetical protein